MNPEYRHDNKLHKNIPEELKRLDRWVCWKLEERAGKPTKIPINPLTGGQAMSNNPETWTDYWTAHDKMVTEGYSGIGFMFNSDGFLGVDIDHCRDAETGELTDLAKDIIGTLDSYTEISQSGTGIHILCRGQLPDGRRRKEPVEMYETGRYFCMTGNVLDDAHMEIEERTDELAAVHKKYVNVKKKAKNDAKTSKNVSKAPVFVDDDKIIEVAMAAKNGDLFTDLMNGNWKGRYTSQSEADIALCNLLAFYCQCDANQMQRMFRRSGLYRDKWNERRGEAGTYGEITINRAVADCGNTYSQHYHINIASGSTRTAQVDELANPEANNKNTDKSYKYTDAGNSERFGDALRGRYLYISEQKAWYRYNGKLWENDISNRIVQDVIKCLRYAQKKAFNISDDDKRTKELSWLLKSESRDKINSALCLMSSIPFMCASISQFDKNDMLLNVQNGTINLVTGVLQKHNKDDYITKICNVKHDTNSKSSLFEAFIEDITEGKQDKKMYLQKLCGYCCTGKVSEEEFYQAKGSGQNGKTKLFETVKYCLGTYAVTASPDILMAKDMSSIPNDIARLQGTRFVLMSEPDPGKRFSDNAVKSLTGGDTIIARYLHKEFFEFQMKAKMIMLTNHEIKAIGTDHGLWRRMVVIPFTYQVPEDKKDKHLQEKLIADAEAVLAWMVDGCLLWQKEELEQPKELIKVKNEYRMGQDAVGLFLDACCAEDPKVKISATSLYKAFIAWCQDTGEYEISQRLFGSRLREKGFTNVKSGTVYWFGLRLLDNLDNLDKKQINTNIKNAYKDLSEISPPLSKRPESINISDWMQDAFEEGRD